MITKRSKNIITILGSGTSTGTPIINCKCNVCRSKSSKNKRLRTSILITTEDQSNILVDTSPDLRQQALRYKITSIDSVIITHQHADHLHGIDDLRQFCFSQNNIKIPTYACTKTSKILRLRFPYIFDADKLFTSKRPVLGGGIPKVKLEEIKTSKTKFSKVKICNQDFNFFLLEHSYCNTLGFIHNKFCYLTDCKKISPQIIKQLKKSDIDLLIIDCLQKNKHHTHLSVEESFEYISTISPKRAGLIHMNHDLDHFKLKKLAQARFSFPVFPVFDGQILTY